jgi:hypothetical protein
MEKKKSIKNANNANRKSRFAFFILFSSPYFCFRSVFSKSDIYNLVAVTSSGILKAKQKLGITFDSDKLGGIDFIKILKLTMCSA